MEDGWLGSVCDLLPYLLCFYISLAGDDSGLYIFIRVSFWMSECSRELGKEREWVRNPSRDQKQKWEYNLDLNYPKACPSWHIIANIHYILHQSLKGFLYILYYYIYISPEGIGFVWMYAELQEINFLYKLSMYV